MIRTVSLVIRIINIAGLTRGLMAEAKGGDGASKKRDLKGKAAKDDKATKAAEIKAKSEEKSAGSASSKAKSVDKEVERLEKAA